MNTIKLAKIGVKAFNGIGADIRFLSNDYLLEYDFIMVSATAILEEFESDPEQFDREEFSDFFEKRLADLKEFYKYGGRMILLIDENPVYAIMEGVEEFKDGKLINLLSTLQPKIEYVLQTGADVTCADVITPLTSNVSISFKALLNHRGNKPLVVTQRTKQPLSYHQKVGNGFFMALPNLYVQEAYNPEMVKEAFTQLVNICDALQQKPVKQVA